MGKQIFVFGLCCLALALESVRLGAQTEAVAAFDSGYVETGNPFVLHLNVPQRFGQPQAVDFSPWDALLPAQSILRQSTWEQRGDQFGIDYTFITFDSAVLSLPPLKVVLPGGDTLRTNTLQLNVLPSPSPNELADIRDIKDIHPEPRNWKDYLFPALPILAGVLVFLLVVWWLLRRGKKSGLKAIRSVQLPPHESALRKLAELERRQYWQNDQLKQYYSELTHIAREYLERRYRIPALESASDEILRQLLHTDLPAPLLTPLSDLFRWADLAKFAKGKPPGHFHEQALREVRQLVELTKPSPADHTPDTAPAAHQIPSNPEPS